VHTPILGNVTILIALVTACMTGCGSKSDATSAAKADAPKADVPKPDASKADAPKPDAPKADAAKPAATACPR